MTPAVNWTWRAHVVRVVDGDTIVALIDTGFATRREERIRLLGVDAPEVVGASKARGLAAKDALAARIEGRSVLLVTEMEKVDGFRRYLGTLWLDGEDINAWLIREGFAGVWTR